MADIEVKIQLQDTVEDSIRVISSPNDVNNASIQKVETAFNRLSVLNDGMNLKSWSTGSLSLADGVVGGSDTSLVEQYGYEGYVFGAVPESKEFPVTIEITGRDIDNIIVYGDKEANQFPTKAYRDSNPNDIIYNSDVDWDITFNDQANTHTITFLEWNRANYNACISHISVKSLSLILGKKWIKNVESLSQSTDRPNEIFYGVLPNSGDLSLVDIDGSLKNYAEEGHFDNSNLSISIFANGKEVKQHILSDSDYDNVTKTLKISLGDALSSWEELQYKGFAYPKKSENAYNMILDVLTSIGYKQNQVDEMLSTDIVYGVDNQVGSVKQYLQEIVIPYPYLPSASVRETIDKFCLLAQLQVYRTDRNEIKFISARPIATEIEKTNIIPIDESRMFENFTKSILLKNKYDGISLENTSVSVGYQYDTGIYTKIIQDNAFNLEDKIYSDTGAVGDYTSSRIDAYYTSGSFFVPYSENLGTIEYISINSSNFSGDNDNKYYYSKFDALDKYETKRYLSNTNFPIEYDTAKSFSKPQGTSEYLFEGIENRNDKVYENMAYTTYTTIETAFEDSGFYTRYDKDNNTFYFSSFANSAIPKEATCSIEDKSNIEIKDTGTGYNITYNILSKLVVCGISYLGQYSQYYISEKYSNAIDITLIGDKKTLVFENVDVSTQDIANSKVIVSLKNSEILQTGAVHNDSVIMSTLIKNNIESDYSKGVSNATISVPCLDYYNEKNEKVKDWSKGEKIEVGDILRVKGDSTLWRVTGRNFRKKGIPMLDLELQEIITLPTKKYIIKFPKEVQIYLDSKELSSGDFVEKNSIVKVSFKNSNGTLISLKNNGIEINNNSYIDVKQNINITVEYYTQQLVIGSFNFPSSNNETLTVNYNPNSYEVVELIVKNLAYGSDELGGIQEETWNYPITNSLQTMNYLKRWTNDSGNIEFAEVAQISANQNNFYISSLSDSSMFNLEGKYEFRYNKVHKS